MPRIPFDSSQRLSGTGTRNTAKLIDIAGSHFEAAHLQGVMALYAVPRERRQVQLLGRNDNVIDFVRCSYLGLDNHPRIVGEPLKQFDKTVAYIGPARGQG